MIENLSVIKNKVKADTIFLNEYTKDPLISFSCEVWKKKILSEFCSDKVKENLFLCKVNPLSYEFLWLV